MVMQYKPYGYSAENDPILVGLQALRQGMSQLAESRQKQQALDIERQKYNAEYGPQELSSAFIQSLPTEDLRKNYTGLQAEQATPEQRQSAAEGQLTPEFFNSENPTVAAPKYANSVSVSKAEAQDLRDLVKAYRTSRATGTIPLGQIAAQRGIPLKEGVDPNILLPAKPEDFLGSPKPDPRAIGPAVKAWYEDWQKGKVGAKDFPALDSMNAAESALYSRALSDEQNQATRGQQRAFHADTVNLAKANLGLRSEEFGYRKGKDAELEAERKTIKDADAEKLAFFSEKINQLNRAYQMAEKVQPSRLKNLEATGKTLLSSITGGAYQPDQDTQDFNEYKALVNTQNTLEALRREGSRGGAPGRMQALQKFQISPNDTVEQQKAKIKGQISVLKDQYKATKTALSPKTPLGQEGLDAEFKAASSGIDKTLGNTNDVPRPARMSDSALIGQARAAIRRGKSKQGVIDQLKAWNVKGWDKL